MGEIPSNICNQILFSSLSVELDRQYIKVTGTIGRFENAHFQPDSRLLRINRFQVVKFLPGHHERNRGTLKNDCTIV